MLVLLMLQKWSAFPEVDSFSLYFKLLHKAKLSSHPRNKETPVKEVTLYYYDRQKFFRLVGLACASQFVFWAWMAYFQLSRVQFAYLLNLESKKSQEKILDVSSKPGVSWKVVRFVEVSSQIFANSMQSYKLLTTSHPFGVGEGGFHREDGLCENNTNNCSVGEDADEAIL